MQTYTVPPEHTETITVAPNKFYEVTYPSLSLTRLDHIEKAKNNIAFYSRVIKGFNAMESKKVIELVYGVDGYLSKLEEAEKEIEIQLSYMQLEVGV